MSNPYLAAALAEQQEKRDTKTSEAPAPEKAAKSASKSDNQPSKEN